MPLDHPGSRKAKAADPVQSLLLGRRLRLAFAGLPRRRFAGLARLCFAVSAGAFFDRCLGFICSRHATPAPPVYAVDGLPHFPTPIWRQINPHAAASFLVESMLHSCVLDNRRRSLRHPSVIVSCQSIWAAAVGCAASAACAAIRLSLLQVTDPRGASSGKWDCFASYRLALVHPSNEAKTIARDSWHRFSGAPSPHSPSRSCHRRCSVNSSCFRAASRFCVTLWLACIRRNVDQCFQSLRDAPLKTVLKMSLLPNAQFGTDRKTLRCRSIFEADVVSMLSQARRRATGGATLRQDLQCLMLGRGMPSTTH